MGRFPSLHAGHGSINYTTRIIYGVPHLFEKITSSRYLGGGPNVLEGSIFTLWRVHISLKKIKIRQMYRGVQMFQRGSTFYSKISSGGSIFFEKLVPGGTNLGGSIFAVTGTPPADSTTHLFQRLAICLWRGNASLWVRRIPIRPSEVDGVI